MKRVLIVFCRSRNLMDLRKYIFKKCILKYIKDWTTAVDDLSFDCFMSISKSNGFKKMHFQKKLSLNPQKIVLLRCMKRVLIVFCRSQNPMDFHPVSGQLSVGSKKPPQSLPQIHWILGNLWILEQWNIKSLEYQNSRILNPGNI